MSYYVWFLLFLALCSVCNLFWGRRAGGRKDGKNIPGAKFIIAGTLGVLFGECLRRTILADDIIAVYIMAFAAAIGFLNWRIWETNSSLTSMHGERDVRPPKSTRFIYDLCVKMLGVPITDGQRRKFATVQGWMRWTWGGLCGLPVLALGAWYVGLPTWWVYLAIIPFSGVVEVIYAVQRYFFDEDSTMRAEILGGLLWGCMKLLPWGLALWLTS